MVKLILYVAITSLIMSNAECNQTKRISRELSFNNEMINNYPNSLRSDGYYHRIDSTSTNIEVLIFSKNGKLFQGYFQSKMQLETFLQKKEVLIESVYYDFATYDCRDEIITIKYPIPVGGNELAARWEVYTEEGKIVKDDNTLLFTKGYRKGVLDYFNHIYKFTQANVPPIRFLSGG